MNKNNAMTKQQANQFLQENRHELTEAFERQFNLPVGGFYNPTVVYADRNEIEFRCFYDNFDNDEDSWTWYYDLKTKEFYH